MLKTHKTMSSENADVFRILVIGKTGTGKSTLCNAILGDDKFKVGRGLSKATLTAERETAQKGYWKLEVTDTPDVTNTSDITDIEADLAKKKAEVSKWRELSMSRPSAVVLTIQCDIRYTKEEFAIYEDIVNLWGDNSIKDNLIVAFTFGDNQAMPIEEQLKTLNPELKSVLRDAGCRYFVFDKTDERCMSGVAYTVIEKAQSRKKTRGGLLETGGSFSRSLCSSFPSDTVFPSLVSFVLIAVIFCCVFVVIDLHEAAIISGAIGLILVASIVILAGKKTRKLPKL